MVYLATFTIRINHSCRYIYIPVPWILWVCVLFPSADPKFGEGTPKCQTEMGDFSRKRCWSSLYKPGSWEFWIYFSKRLRTFGGEVLMYMLVDCFYDKISSYLRVFYLHVL